MPQPRRWPRFLVLLAIGLIAVPGAVPVRAAVLDMVPMQGGMVMPALAYSATTGRLSIEMEHEIPLLVPLRISHPGDSFRPEDPWFDALDPSRQGQAFSRRYGFVMSPLTDPIPAGTAITLHLLEASPELSFYRYMMGPPGGMAPLFGTAGTDPAWRWNGMMFHPLVMAPAVEADLEAIFEATLVDSVTGARVDGSETEPFVLRWVSVSDGRPVLGIATRIVLEWDVQDGEWVAEAAPGPEGPWTALEEAPIPSGSRRILLVTPSPGARFFRLRETP
jgi:hypothetical protein